MTAARGGRQCGRARWWPVRAAVFVACLAPFAVAVWDGLTDGLGPNPVEAVTHCTGDWALGLLLATLAVSPLRRLTGWTALLRVRRILGLFAFAYAVLHVLVWIGLDQGWSLSGLGGDLVKRPYIALGFTAFVLMLPLALTSSRGWQGRLGRRWVQIHRLAYAAAAAAVLHFVWLVKADYREPAVYAGVLIVLLAARVRAGGGRR